jgi:hypothetical protein
MKIEQPKCGVCGQPLNLCDGDVLQIYQEMIDDLECDCPTCGYTNTVKITESTVKLESIDP